MIMYNKDTFHFLHFDFVTIAALGLCLPLSSCADGNSENMTQAAT